MYGDYIWYSIQCGLQNKRIKIRFINRNETTSTLESIKERALKL